MKFEVTGWSCAGRRVSRSFWEPGLRSECPWSAFRGEGTAPTKASVASPKASVPSRVGAPPSGRMPLAHFVAGIGKFFAEGLGPVVELVLQILGVGCCAAARAGMSHLQLEIF